MMTSKGEILAYIRQLYYVDCFTYNCGNRLIDISCGFIHTAPCGHAIEAVAELIRQEGKLLHVRAKVYDKTEGKLLIMGQSVMFSVADYPEIPEQW